MSDRQPYINESPEAQAARAAKLATPFGAILGAAAKPRVVGRALSLNTVIGLAVTVLILAGIGVFSGKIRLSPQPSTDSVPAAVRDYLDNHTLPTSSGSIQMGGVSVLFVSSNTEYETARLAVNLPQDSTFVNGSFGESGKAWCVHVREGSRDVVTTNYYEKVSTATTKWSCAADGLLGINVSN